MSQCCKIKTQDRPTFKELAKKLDSLLTEQHKKVNFILYIKYMLDHFYFY